MANDDLHKPLGLPVEGAPRRPPRLRARRAFLAAAIALTSAGAGYLYLADDGEGGRARAIATIEREGAPPSPRATDPAARAQAPADAGPTPTGAIAAASPRVSGAGIEASSGVRVIRQGGEGAPGALIISIPETPRIGLAPAPDPRLVENSRFGPLPRIGADGARPSEVYARPLLMTGALTSRSPQIALVVGGMGLNRDTTRRAIEALPPAVTLAFAPYGDRLGEQVADARAAGHEVLLQTPMEPFSMADADKSARMLMTGQSRARVRDGLHWHMGRFAGYVGIANFLGGKFTSDAAALGPVIEELRARGLIYFDDGSSPRSIAATMAASAGVAFVRADVNLDRSRDGAGLDGALVQLEAIARRDGFAAGFASALPGVSERLARFADGLEARGVALIPLGVAASRNARASASRGQP